jgi:hypothetical protein
MAPFYFDPLGNYEVDRWAFDYVLRLHNKVMETSRLGWLVLGGYDLPKIVVSQLSDNGLVVFSAGTLAERMRDGLRELQDFINEMFDKLSNADGAKRDQLERAIVLHCTLLDIWCQALCNCTASQDRLIQACRFVVERLRSALEKEDLRNPATFGGLMHEINLKIKEAIGVCVKSLPESRPSAA